MRLIKPNFKNCNLNVSATISSFLGNENDLPKNKLVAKSLAKNYKNVVFMCIDGLGMYPITQNLEKTDFLRANIKSTMTSVFPSTTTNATSSLYSATYPSEHGMLGWSLYFDELKRCVDIYLGTDDYTGEKVDMSKIEDKLKFEYYFDHVKTDYNISAIFPSFVKHEKNTYFFEKCPEAFDILDKVCKKKTKQFVYLYLHEPDSTMHEFGVSSEKAKSVIKMINDKIEEFHKKHPDTLIIATADHGQTDIKEYIRLYEDKALMKTLKVPMYLEARAVAFQIKDGQHETFKQEMKKYKKDLKLFKVEDLIKKNYFGSKTEKLKVLGDYIAVVKNYDKIVCFSKETFPFKGHHTSLTKHDMIVPLIIVE